VGEDFEAPRILREYLLGRLPEDQQERVDKQLMTDREFLERIRVAEQELADEYAAGALRGEETQSFERIFLAHPSRRRQTAFAHALRRYVQSSRGKEPSRGNLLGLLRINGRRLQAAWVAASLLVVMGGVWLSFTANRLRHERDAIAAEQRSRAEDLQRERTEKAKMEEQIRELKSTDAKQQPPVAFVVASLLPGLVRDVGGSQRIILSPETIAVRLELLLENETYGAYSAVIETAGGNPIWSQKGLQVLRKAGSSNVIVLLSSDALPPQDYVLRLDGIRADGLPERAASYYFRVLAK